MTKQESATWWQDIPLTARGDVIIGQVGANARGVAIGKGITQTVYGVLGEPEPDDGQNVQRELGVLKSRLDESLAGADGAVAQMAAFQYKLLATQLQKTGEDAVPDGDTITQVSDWLLEQVPAIAETLASVFATPAVGRVVGKAGEGAIAWLKQRFGRSASSA